MVANRRFFGAVWMKFAGHAEPMQAFISRVWSAPDVFPALCYAETLWTCQSPVICRITQEESTCSVESGCDEEGAKEKVWQ